MTINSKKIKVLFIITQSEFGGAQRFLCDLAINLNQDKYDFIVAAGPQGNDKNGLLARLQRKNIKTYPLRHLKREINPINDIKAFFEIKKLMGGLKPDVVYLNSTKAGVIGSLTSRIFTNLSQISRIYSRKFVGNSRPLVIYRIGGWAFNEPLPKWKKWLYILAEKWTAKYKDIIITNSKADREKAIKLGIRPKDKIIAIYNGINAASMKFLPKEEARKKLFSDNQFLSLREIPRRGTIPNFSTPEGRDLASGGQFPIIGSIANLYPSKGLEYLIRAAALINSKQETINKKQNSNIYFIIIGDGKLRAKLENLIKKYGLTDTFFLIGYLPDAYKYLKAFDIFILPSIKEGMPWCLLEAMAAETPVIATDVGGIPEIINYETCDIPARRSPDDHRDAGGKHETITETGGIMIKPKNPEQIAEAIEIILQNNNLRSQFVQNAKKCVEENFNLRKMIKENEKILDEL